jgi:hypothetical protein
MTRLMCVMHIWMDDGNPKSAVSQSATCAMPGFRVNRDSNVCLQQPHHARYAVCLTLPVPPVPHPVCTCTSAQTRACPDSTEIHSIVKPPAKLNGQKGIFAAFAFVLVAYVTMAVSAYWVCGVLLWESTTYYVVSYDIRLHLGGFSGDGSLLAACRLLATTSHSWCSCPFSQ